MKEIIDIKEVTIVSNRNPAIISTVRDIFGNDRHAFCYMRMKENFSVEYTRLNRGSGRTSGKSKEDVLKMLDTIAYARHEFKYNVALVKLKLFSPQLAQWVRHLGTWKDGGKASLLIWDGIN